MVGIGLVLVGRKGSGYGRALVEVSGSVGFLGHSSDLAADVLELELNGVILGERLAKIGVGDAFSL